MKSIAIIVPVLNEADNLPGLIAHLSRFIQADVEIVFVDGGSTDKTQHILLESKLQTVSAPRGRALQMNAGVLHSDAEILVFMHADTLLPPGALKCIAKTINDGANWGRFDVRISGTHPMFGIIAFMMNLRSRLSGIATGDQVIFMNRTIFNAAGGFPEQLLMEDIEISKRLKQINRPVCLREKVTTSGRRWQKNGVWKTIFLMWRLRFKYWRGVSSSILAEFYR